MPRAVFWYRWYCYSVALFNLVLTGICLLFILRNRELSNEVVAPGVIWAVGVACAPLALALAVFNAVLPGLKPKPGLWAMNLTNIVVGLGTCVLIPLALPLLLSWFDPRVRAYYGSR